MKCFVLRWVVFASRLLGDAHRTSHCDAAEERSYSALCVGSLLTEMLLTNFE